MNRSIPFYIRPPKGFIPGKSDKAHRLLFLCPYMNREGLTKLAGSKAYLEMADRRGWFVMTCTFKQDKKHVRDRERSFYYPEGFSGEAVLEALDVVAGKFPVDTGRLLLQGLSGGAQFVHRFAMWAPERVTAVAVNSSSWFDSPGKDCNQVAWLVTIGDSDPSFDASLTVTDELREVGALPVFRSYIGMLHEAGGRKVERLNLAFLEFYDEKTKNQLGTPVSRLDLLQSPVPVRAEEMPFIGDGQMATYLENTGENVENLPEELRVFLPNKEVAELWGEYAGGAR